MEDRGKRLVPVSITATDLDDVWYKVIWAIMEQGYRYSVKGGSYVGTDRIELDMVTLNITHPTSGPLLPILPDGLGIPPLADENYVKCEYFPTYIMGSELAPNEEYTYGQRIWMPVYDDILDETRPQIEWAIKRLRDSDGDTNQATIEIGQPSDIAVHAHDGSGYDPPCMRLIDLRLREGVVHITVYFRSWDAWGGLPVNLGGLELLKQYVASELGAESGQIIAFSKGLHIYGHVEELAKIRTHHQETMVGQNR